MALGPDAVTWTIFSRGSPISLDLEISTGLGGESWDEKCVGILGAWSPRLLDSSVGKSRDQATNKQTAVLMEAPIYPLLLFPLSGTCFRFPYLQHLSKNFGCFTLLFCSTSPTTSQEAFSIEPNSPYVTQPVIL